MLSKITFTLMLVCYVSGAAINAQNSAFLANDEITLSASVVIPTCNDVSLSGTTLTATGCNNGKGSTYDPASINLDEKIGNDNGNITTKFGGAKDSCKDVKLEGNQLKGQCKDKVGNYQDTSFDISYHLQNTGSKLNFMPSQMCNSFTLNGTMLGAKCGGNDATPVDLKNCVSVSSDGMIIGMQKGQTSFTGNGCTITPAGVLSCGEGKTQTINLVQYVGNSSTLSCNVAMTTPPSGLNNECYDMKLEGDKITGSCANGLGGLLPGSTVWNGKLKVSGIGALSVSSK